MKKILLVTLLVLSLFVIGCKKAAEEPVVNQEVQTEVTVEVLEVTQSVESSEI